MVVLKRSVSIGVKPLLVYGKPLQLGSTGKQVFPRKRYSLTPKPVPGCISQHFHAEGFLSSTPRPRQTTKVPNRSVRWQSLVSNGLCTIPVIDQDTILYMGYNEKLKLQLHAATPQKLKGHAEA